MAAGFRISVVTCISETEIGNNVLGKGECDERALHDGSMVSSSSPTNQVIQRWIRFFSQTLEGQRTRHSSRFYLNQTGSVSQRVVSPTNL